MYDFNIFSVLTLVASEIYLLLSIYTLSKNPKAISNRLFVFVAASMALWGLGEGMERAAADPEIAYFWANYIAGLGATTHPAFLMHFWLEFSGDINTFRKKIPIWTLYVPSAIFLAIRFFAPNLLVTGVTKEYWGYSTVGTELYQIYMLFIVVYVAAVVYLSLMKARHSEGIFKFQARNIGLGVLFSVSIGMITQAMRPILGLAVPELGVMSSLIFVLFMAYAINKYGMLTITTKIVAQNIIATMNDLVVAVDKNMNIAMVNNAITQYGAKNLLNTPIKKILSGEDTPLEYGKLLEQSPLIDRKMNLIDREGKKIPVSVNISAIKEGGHKEALGLVFVMRDTREMDELVKNLREKGGELEKKNSELEQFNKLAVGRELKMIELKNRIRELEGGKKSDSTG
ncbi:MAG: histidine kinase N-terminal 7TM domain-containing protein [Candidatus Falkowbacteria bacterium]